MPCLPLKSCPVVLPTSVNTGCAGCDGRRSSPCARRSCCATPRTDDRPSVACCHTRRPSSQADPPCASLHVPFRSTWQHLSPSQQTTVLGALATHAHGRRTASAPVIHNASLSPVRVESPRRSHRRRVSHLRLLERYSFQPLHCCSAMSLHTTRRSPAVKMNHFLVTARQARCPLASQKVTSFDCSLFPPGVGTPLSTSSRRMARKELSHEDELL